MDEINQSSHYFDLASLDELRQQAQQDPDASLRKVAQQFEGIFLNMMLKSMREANVAFKDEDSPFNSQNTQFYEQMHDQQMTSQLSSQGSLGLAELMVLQLGGGQEVNASATLDEHSLSPLRTVNHNRGSRELSGNDLANDEVAAAADNSLVELGVLSSEVGIETQPLTFTQPDEFVQALLPAAAEAAKKLNKDPHLLIAQAALETGWGRSILPGNEGKSSHNLFNIKADNRWDGEKTAVNALEFENNVAVMKRSSFRVYDDLKASFDDYVSFLQQPRYSEALKATDAAGFASGLQQAGYATDPHYATKILSVFQRLTQQRLNQ
ncbi:flagellar assembly peptidoglycan hydrolase FlgJ [Ferrimonas lipolytica]|uniref:Peptidoglycan hydrolase FlgJ n=1 Tax=Ferrimonas lipolytica TaxID=2724191 RepID=A0A6H1UDT5_9GAMM|nr:flagellar assembly peptidoglycan hydrolase FlgJ [Ferrimonas lipolytica]QIZ77245.1 flagellar assembly peptidoglycan hydrolase FlgJ [Ferrimonas lipolytica]